MNETIEERAEKIAESLFNPSYGEHKKAIVEFIEDALRLREALNGAATYERFDGDCWDEYCSEGKHEPGCSAAKKALITHDELVNRYGRTESENEEKAKA